MEKRRHSKEIINMLQSDIVSAKNSEREEDDSVVESTLSFLSQYLTLVSQKI